MHAIIFSTPTRAGDAMKTWLEIKDFLSAKELYFSIVFLFPPLINPDVIIRIFVVHLKPRNDYEYKTIHLIELASLLCHRDECSVSDMQVNGVHGGFSCASKCNPWWFELYKTILSTC